VPDARRAFANESARQEGDGIFADGHYTPLLFKSGRWCDSSGAKDSADTSSRDSVRVHLTHIKEAFSDGDFDIPVFVHDTVPPGVPKMKKLREKLYYSLEETSDGARRVFLSTSDQEALAAIHQFLIFQIEEHKSGDPMEMR
jgi:hypothetical protein